LKQTHAYKVDLAKIDGKGAFPCPRCGGNISPDDFTEEAYSILGTKVNKQGLEELEMRCSKCGSQLHLTGFAILQMLSEKDKEINENGTIEKAQFYINHI
jgi:ribosomal protein S27AE